MLCYIVDINSGDAAAAYAAASYTDAQPSRQRIRTGVFASESPAHDAAYDDALLEHMANEAAVEPVHNQMEAAAEVQPGMSPALQFVITAVSHNKHWRDAVNNLVLGKGPSSHCLASVVSLKVMKTNGIWYVYHRSACGDVQEVTQ